MGLGCGWVCDPPPKPIPISGPVQAKYLVTHVVYALPGRSSSLAYANMTAVGSTVTVTDSTSDQVVVTAGTGPKEMALIPSGSFEVKSDNTWGSSQSTSTDITVLMKDGYQKFGEQDGINHDDDEVWFVANPPLVLTYTPASYYGPASESWTMDPSAPVPSIYYLTVGELKGTVALAQGVKDALAYWGIEPATDFPQMLKADPAVSWPLDPSRYLLLGQWPYVPVNHAGDIPSPQQHLVDRKVTDTTTEGTSTAYAVSIKAGASFAFLGWPIARWSIQNVWTLKHSSDTRGSVMGEKSITLTVGQPTFGYSGPTILRAYEDRIWHTIRVELESH